MVEATLGTARFYSRSGPYSLAVVASVAPGVADELELLLEGVAPLQTARPNEVSFLDNRRCASALEQTSAGAVPSMVLMSRRSLLGQKEPPTLVTRAAGSPQKAAPLDGCRRASRTSTMFETHSYPRRASGFASWRALPMKSCATGLIVRFLTVMIPTGNDGVGNSTGKILSGGFCRSATRNREKSQEAVHLR